MTDGVAVTRGCGVRVSLARWPEPRTSGLACVETVERFGARV